VFSTYCTKGKKEAVKKESASISLFSDFQGSREAMDERLEIVIGMQVAHLPSLVYDGCQ
jgi:hypothetical protein